MTWRVPSGKRNNQLSVNNRWTSQNIQQLVNGDEPSISPFIRSLFVQPEYVSITIRSSLAAVTLLLRVPSCSKTTWVKTPLLLPACHWLKIITYKTNKHTYFTLLGCFMTIIIPMWSIFVCLRPISDLKLEYFVLDVVSHCLSVDYACQNCS